MESIIVGLIVIAAVVFSIRGFVRIYKGDGGCSCGEASSCKSRHLCDENFPIVNRK